MLNLCAPERTVRRNTHLALVLTAIAGILNSVGFVAVATYTSHMTGIVASMADAAVLHAPGLVGTGLLALAMFILGAVVCALVFNWGRVNGLRSRYANILLLEGVGMLVFGLLAEHVRDAHRPLVVVAVLCFTMGLQNALITRIGAWPIRTTHVTGMVTDAILPGATTFAATRALLRDSRMWVGWQGVGAQMGVLDVLRSYALRREQFGRPLAAFQLIQAQIAEVAGNLAASAGMMLQVDALRQEGRMEMMHAAMAKATSTRLARSSAALARDALGGNGLLTEHEIAKIMGDVEAIYSYEGSYGMNTLIVGRALTGVSAFV